MGLSECGGCELCLAVLFGIRACNLYLRKLRTQTAMSGLMPGLSDLGIPIAEEAPTQLQRQYHGSKIWPDGGTSSESIESGKGNIPLRMLVGLTVALYLSRLCRAIGSSRKDGEGPVYKNNEGAGRWRGGRKPGR